MAVVSEIHNQVRLPLSVAFEVAIQGIRIRLGRSLITLVGIALGIAFLMSILMTHAYRKGVERETIARGEVQRMLSFLTAETGPLNGRKIAIIQAGNIDQREQRLVERIAVESPSNISWFVTPPSLEITCRHPSVLRVQSISSAVSNADGVIVLGAGELPSTDWKSLMKLARKQIVAFSRSERAEGTDITIEPVILEYKPKEDEIEEMQAEARRAAFRTVWIVVISLLVTVIGVSNAMLMSVTERFREIGTMKCLGALSLFIRQLFLMESLMMGIVGSVAGSIFGAAFSYVFFGFTYGFGFVAVSVNWSLIAGAMLFSVIAGTILAVIAAIYPAAFAARMVPATALRSNV